MSPGAGSESVVRAELCGDRGGASSPRAHAVLLQALQRSRPVAARRQHRLRLQGQPGHLPAGWFRTDALNRLMSSLCMLLLSLIQLILVGPMYFFYSPQCLILNHVHFSLFYSTEMFIHAIKYY